MLTYLRDATGRPTVRWLLLTVTVYLLGWGATVAAELWFGRHYGLVLAVGMLTTFAVLGCISRLGGQWLAMWLAMVTAFVAPFFMPDTVSDRVLLDRGVVVQVRVVSVVYGKADQHEGCGAVDAGTGRPIPGTLRNCVSEPVGDRISATVDPQGGVAPFVGLRSDIADDLSHHQPLLESALALQALAIATAWLRARRRQRGAGQSPAPL